MVQAVSRLFKYRSLSTPIQLEWVLQTIERGTVYFAAPREFNDPFDCKPNISFSSDSGARERYVKRITRKHGSNLPRNQRRHLVRQALERWQSKPDKVMADLQAGWNRSLGNIGLYCVCETPLDILMWSHYADGHRGICFEFDSSKDENITRRALPVTYQTNYPSVDIGSSSNEEIALASYLTKAHEWHYERERRVFDYHCAGMKQLGTNELVNIYLGAAIPPAHEDTVRAAAKGRNIDVTRLHLHQSQYQVVAVT